MSPLVQSTAPFSFVILNPVMLIFAIPALILTGHISIIFFSISKSTLSIPDVSILTLSIPNVSTSI